LPEAGPTIAGVAIARFANSEPFLEGIKSREKKLKGGRRTDSQNNIISAAKITGEIGETLGFPITSRTLFKGELQRKRDEGRERSI